MNWMDDCDKQMHTVAVKWIMLFTFLRSEFHIVSHNIRNTNKCVNYFDCFPSEMWIGVGRYYRNVLDAIPKRLHTIRWEGV